MEYLGAELCFISNFQGLGKKVKNSKRVSSTPIWNFFGTAQYTDDRMGNAPNILCLGCKEQKESQS